jgi:hypothetical protein
MTAIALYAAVKFWLPLLTAFGLVIKAYGSTKRGITAWADTLMNNHLSHIQAATEETARLLRDAIKSDEEHRKADLEVLQEIKTGIEVLKDRP